MAKNPLQGDLLPPDFDGDMKRRSGRSTIIALRTIALAMENPGRALRIMDHAGTSKADQFLMAMIQDMVNAMGFEHFIFDRSRCTIKFGDE